ncbi:MAG: hypothetical protein A2511_09480 [Deltaproteobacteria bacterium RIFOXYD12_FULL_50_9]|nr:MAG: hypothetical protein A2511_09480 [Deltaproteobacteria bacterium RIFOXYD12_FULL_50_9]
MMRRIIAGSGAVVLLGFLLFALFYWLVVISPGEEISLGYIERILSMESPVYYRDGINPIGVFFEDSHRQYVAFAQIPKNFVDALIAAEDNTFYEHHGVDLMGLVRAMSANIRAGRIVQGGSTISQQTAKNLFKRQDRSILSKLKELLYAWRLEYHYSKEKILEFYSNQFYVSGNGRGLGVAARYYFDKSVEDLDLLECAFIAGSVKRPNYYNPFIKKDDEEGKKAREEARSRTRYVLHQLYRIGKLGQEELQKYSSREIPFKRGQMTYSMNTTMDQIRVALADPAVEEVLLQQGIDNIATSGVRIVTTIDKDIQEDAEYAVRKELSRLDVMLSGYERGELQKLYAGLTFGAASEKHKGGFLIGRVLSVRSTPGAAVGVTFMTGDKAKVEGVVDLPGLLNILDPLMKFRRNLWTKAGSDDLPAILSQIRQGDLIYVSIRGVNVITGEYQFDLEKYPALQGAVLAIKEGTIRAMVGGMDNRFYNRAISANRPMGSVMKPLVYAAALQLGWNSIDVLNNERNIFVYQKQPYYPRPDHISPYRSVSMSFAGVSSENLATVWLLDHLCDQLSPAQFRELVNQLDLGLRADESYQAYQMRIRDEYGIIVDEDALYLLAFSKAVAEIEPDLIFAGKTEESELLRTFQYGIGFDRFQVENEADMEDTEQAAVVKDIGVRRELLKRNFLRIRKLWSELVDLRQQLRGKSLPEPEDLKLYRHKKTMQLVYGAPLASQESDWQRLSLKQFQALLAAVSPAAIEDFWDEVLIDGLLSVGSVKILNDAVEREYQRLAVLPGYGPEVLFNIHDFRVLAGLRYLVGFCRAIGIESKLDPVLSFPLGSNVITILEVVRAYEGLVSGYTYPGDSGSKEVISIIERIEDPEGKVLFTPKSTRLKAIDPQTSLAVSDILRNVVKFGTGRHAYNTVRLHSRESVREAQLKDLDIRVPLLGKTGTANRYTNSAFAGVVPAAGSGSNVILDGGYVMAAYVGYDDNKPMTHNTIRISGSAGALPIWTRVADAILKSKEYGTSMDLVDLSFAGHAEIPLVYPEIGQIEVPGESLQVLGANTSRGEKGLPGSSYKASILTFGDFQKGGRVNPARYFKPYWSVKEN